MIDAIKGLFIIFWFMFNVLINVLFIYLIFVFIAWFFILLFGLAINQWLLGLTFMLVFIFLISP